MTRPFSRSEPTKKRTVCTSLKIPRNVVTQEPTLMPRHTTSQGIQLPKSSHQHSNFYRTNLLKPPQPPSLKLRKPLKNPKTAENTQRTSKSLTVRLTTICYVLRAQMRRTWLLQQKARSSFHHLILCLYKVNIWIPLLLKRHKQLLMHVSAANRAHSPMISTTSPSIAPKIPSPKVSYNPMPNLMKILLLMLTSSLRWKSMKIPYRIRPWTLHATLLCLTLLPDHQTPHPTAAYPHATAMDTQKSKKWAKNLGKFIMTKKYRI